MSLSTTVPDNGARLGIPTRLYDAYIFDLDGTVYLGESLLPTAGETIEALRRLGRRTVFLSNNPTETRDTYARKLTRLGLATPAGDVINSSLVMAQFLGRTMPGARLFVVGEQPLLDVLSEAGFEMSDDPRQIDAVIASFDRTFAYSKLQTAFDAIRAGAKFFATNGDRYCPVPGGGQPDAAAVIAAIEACTDTTIEAIVGKPSKHMAQAILDLVDLPPDRCLMIGDRLETDVLMGLDSGMDAALTLTGATSAEQAAASEIRPTYVIRQLSDLVRL
ncbi:MAG: HAD-IIA family hydrolase [Chloroflexota bacterium]|nr:HAD-IIA family hydrolase [Chloroflexota bacterium]